MSYLDSDFYDCNKNDDIGLEPRLMEYIKKLQFFKENGIDTSLLKREFAITEIDISKIKAYQKGDKSKYSNCHTDMVDFSKAQFPSSELKKDPRLERIKAKQRKETEASEQRHDYGIISKSYDMYRNDRPFASASGNDFSKSDFHPDEWFKSSRDEMVEPDSQYDLRHNSAFSNSNTYVNPRSSYNGYLDNKTVVNSDKHTLDDIIGKLDTYTKQSEKIPKRENWMDVDYKVTMPNCNSNKSVSRENNYQPVPLKQASIGNFNNQMNQNDNKTRDMDVDTYMKFGETPMRAGKSLGYPSVLEHSFSYISSDIQDPNHIVMDRGIPSRVFNKDIARPSLNRGPMR